MALMLALLSLTLRAQSGPTDSTASSSSALTGWWLHPDSPFGSPVQLVKLPSYSCLNCWRLAADDQGNLYALHSDAGLLHKFHALQGYDSVNVIGGPGFAGEAMLGPRDISVPIRQNIFVMDNGNRRVLLFDTNLKLVREVDGRNLEIRVDGQVFQELMIGQIGVSKTGELFLYDEFLNKILKLDRFGRYEVAFGGSSYGEGSFFQPSALLVTPENDVWVLDTSIQKWVQYNLSGNVVGVYTAPENGIDPAAYCWVGGRLWYVTAAGLWGMDPLTGDETMLPLPASRSFITLAAHPEGLLAVEYAASGSQAVTLYRFKR